MADNLEKEIEIQAHEGFLEVRFLGAFTVLRFKRQVDLAVQVCRERGMALLLLDYTGLTGVPSTLERYEISVHGAKVAKDLTRLAGFARPEQVGEKFGALVARNRGLNVDVFADRGEAVAWLLGKAGSGTENGT